jgi:hypothetical protein
LAEQPVPVSALARILTSAEAPRSAPESEGPPARYMTFLVAAVAAPMTTEYLGEGSRLPLDLSPQLLLSEDGNVWVFSDTTGPDLLFRMAEFSEFSWLRLIANYLYVFPDGWANVALLQWV